MQVATIGVDLAKSVFQVHGVDAAGRVVAKALRRGQVLAFFGKLRASNTLRYPPSSFHAVANFRA